MLTSLFRSALVIALLALVAACDRQPDRSDEGEDPPTEPIPEFSINTNGATIVDDPKIAADFTITHKGETLHVGKMGIEFRGSSSQRFPKKSYGFETWDEEGNDIDATLLGFPEEEDWILYAPYSDKTFFRNVLIYDLARDMGHYASRTKFVNVNINGEYIGVYIFMEKLKRDGNRIDINKLKEDENEGEDLTGGYIIKIDKEEAFTSKNSFISNYGANTNGSGRDIRFLYDYPKAEDITEEQKSYISTYVNGFEDALVSNAFSDPNTGYATYIDVDSFIDFFILNEVSNNVDGYRLSTWLHKDKNEKLKMGPIWDFNLGFGNANYCGGGKTNIWTYKYNERCTNDYYSVPFWWEKLLEDPAFVTRLQARWTSLRRGILSDAEMISKIEDYVAIVKNGGAVKANYDKWAILAKYVWPNSFVGKSYNSEVDYMKNWIISRNQWLDDAIGAL